MKIPNKKAWLEYLLGIILFILIILISKVLNYYSVLEPSVAFILTLIITNKFLKK
jgi:hypothetical protein